MKRVLLFRHGEAEKSSSSGMDQDRTLTEAGKECFRKNALVLKGKTDLAGACFLCSSALRAVLSLRIFLETLGLDPESIRQEEFLYAAGADRICQTLRELPEASDSAVLVLHNPAVSEAVIRLTGQPFSGFRAGEGAVLEFDASRWNELTSSALAECVFLRRKP